MICEFDHPLESIMGKQFGEFITKEHLKNGVKLHTKTLVKELITDASGNVTSVILTNGE